jgi:hypothetical protein
MGRLMELHQAIERVNSKESFLAFVAALRADLALHRNEDSWENPDLERYLEAMQRWTEDSGDKVPMLPSWQTFADMLYAAKIYE